MAIDKNTIIREAQKYVARNQFDKAIAEWKKLLKETPNDPNIYNTIGDLCLKKDSKASAVEAYHKAADLLAADGFTSKAIALYKKILNIDINQIEVHLALGDMNVEKGLTGNALENYKFVADHYTRNKETAKALTIYQKMADLNDSNVAFRVKLGDMYAKEGMKQEAARAYLAAADVHLSKNEFKDARHLFEKVLALDPNNKEVYHKAGIVYFKEEKFVEACKALKPAFESDPSNKELIEIYLEALDKAGKDVEAEQVLRKLLAENPDNADLREKLYNLYLAKKDFEKAIVEAATLADEKIESGNAGEAEEIYKTFVAGSPYFPPIRQKLAEFYISVNRPLDAAAELMQAAELFEAEGDLQSARAVLTQAITIAPDLSEVGERLKRLPTDITAAPPPEPAFTTAEEPVTAAPSPIVHELEPSPVIEMPPPPPTPASPIAEAPVLVEEDPAITEAFTECDVLIKYGLADKAVEQLEALCVNFPENPRIRIKLRDLYQEQGNIDKAVRHALLAAALYTKYGRDDQAAAELQKTFEMAPDHPAVLSALGRVPVAPEEVHPPEIIPDHIETPLAETEISPPAPEEIPAEAIILQEPAPARELTFEELEKAPVLPQPEEPMGKAPEEVLPSEIMPEHLEAPLTELEISPPPPEEISWETMPPQEPIQTGEIEFEGLDSEMPPLEEATPFETAPVSEPAERERQPVDEEPPFGEVPSFEEPTTEERLPAEEEFAGEKEQPVFEPAEKAVVHEQPAEIDIGELWAEAEFYFQQGLFDEAKKHYTQIIALTPGNPRAIDRLAEISREENETREFSKLTDAVEGLEGYLPPEATEGVLAASASDDEAVRSLMQEIQELKQQPAPPPLKGEKIVAPPPEISASADDRPLEPEQKAAEEDFFDLGAELQRESASAQQGKAAAEEFFDLASELRDELGDVPVPAQPAVPAEEQSLDDIFEEFKRGVEEQSVKEDADTHYNLGVAYKEMGLLDDAIGEFMMTSEDEPKLVQSRYMLGLCYMEKGEYQNAIDEMLNALDYATSLGFDADDSIKMHYDLGLAYQCAGNISSAADEFQKVVDQDPGYRDTTAKLKELQKGDYISLEQLRDDIEKEISSKFLEEGERIEREEKTKKNERVGK
ncbi:MAG: tetratricopeptide repeat protein [Nitrospirae bacterium]|nr:tetratricopeptide repeat protein [Nitrospirota bacterium]